MDFVENLEMIHVVGVGTHPLCLITFEKMKPDNYD